MAKVFYFSFLRKIAVGDACGYFFLFELKVDKSESIKLNYHCFSG